MIVIIIILNLIYDINSKAKKQKTMKKLLILSFSLIISFSAFSQTSLYENPNFDAIASKHEIIAIVPFRTTITLRPKQMEKITPEQLVKMQEAEGKDVQLGMYSWFLKREKQGKLRVKVQDPNISNAKLAKEGITMSNIIEYTPDELAKLLGVDAVISGTFETSKPMSEGASVALGLLVGFWGATNTAVINLFIHNGEDAELLVNYNKKISGSVGSSTEDLVNILMRKASRRVSYTK